MTLLFRRIWDLAHSEEDNPMKKKYANSFLAILIVLPLFFSIKVQSETLYTAFDDTLGDPFVRTGHISGTPAVTYGGQLYAKYGSQVDVFKIQYNGFVVQPSIIPENGTQDDGFGNAIAATDEWLVIGAPNDSVGGEKAGAVYFYQKVGSKWVQRDKWLGAESEELGNIIVSDGNRAAVKFKQGSQSGVRIFQRQDSAWSFQQTIIEPDNFAYNFATSLALENGTLVIGSTASKSLPYNRRVGKAIVYEEETEGWVGKQRLEIPESDDDDNFGASVAISNGRIAVGKTTRADDTQSPGVHLYERDESGWIYRTSLFRPEGYWPQGFGLGVAMDGDYLMITSLGSMSIGPIPGFVFFYTYIGDQWVLTSSFEGGPNYGEKPTISGFYATVRDDYATEVYKAETDFPTADEGEDQVVDNPETNNIGSHGSGGCFIDVVPWGR